MPGREFMMRYLLEDSTNSEKYLLFILNGDKDLVYGIRQDTAFLSKLYLKYYYIELLITALYLHCMKMIQ